jgi:hypothetical protein
MIHISPVISAIPVTPNVPVSFLWKNSSGQWLVILSGISQPAHFSFVISSSTSGHDWESHHHQQWQRRYREFTQSPKLLWGTINIYNPFSVSSPLSRLHQLSSFLFWMFSIHLQPLPTTCSDAPSIWLPILLKPVTSILVRDNVMNHLFFSSSWLTCLCLTSVSYLSNMSLLVEIHELSSTCLTCVCLMMNALLPGSHFVFNMCYTHVYFTFF